MDIAENNSEALWGALLSHQRLDLNALQDWLGHSGVGIGSGVEYGTEKRCKSFVRRYEDTLTHASEPWFTWEAMVKYYQ